MKHASWTDIEGFHNVRKAAAKYEHMVRGAPVVTYRGKVKLHGTCGAVAIAPDGEVAAMSRNAVLSSGSDNAGFHAWTMANAGAFSRLARWDKTLVIYGEWCGPGIQRGTAVNSIPKRAFAIFAARELVDGAGVRFIVEPAELAELAVGSDSHVLPWFNGGEEFVVDWSSTHDALQAVVDRINAAVASVEECDPWVASTFGVSGLGEGLVFYPVSQDHAGYAAFGDLAFKAKGEKHRVVAHTRPAQVNPETAATAAAFAGLVVTPARLEQGCRAVNAGELTFPMSNVGQFLAWVGRDIDKECQDELEASGLDHKAAMRACNAAARDWYIEGAKRETI